MGAKSLDVAQASPQTTSLPTFLTVVPPCLSPCPAANEAKPHDLSSTILAREAAQTQS